MNSNIVFQILDEIPNKAELARHLNISRQSINNWKINGIPIKHVPALCKYLNYKFTPSQIYPEIFEP